MIFDSVVETLNLWGAQVGRIAWPLFWQSSILMIGMFLVDAFLRRRLRPSVRHALWLVVLFKLLLPPSFASPSGIGWWLRPRETTPAKPPVTSYVVTYGPLPEPRSSPREEAPSSFLPVLPSVRLSTSARALLASAAVSATLMIIMLERWRRLGRQLRPPQLAPLWLLEMARDTQRQARCRGIVRLSLTDASISPALCGLFRPVIVLPKALVKQLTPTQLCAVLLHELFHLRNGHVWINCFQSLLQIVFWWHPFLWLANARIRRVREDVVDDAVRLALGAEAESYAPTLLEVARLALARPVATLGLVGMLESRNALRQRVDRLVNFPAPRRAGLSTISGLAIIAFASVALPMGQAPPKRVDLVTQVLARNDSVSNLSRYRVDSPEQPLDSIGLDIQDGLSGSPDFDAAIVGNTASGAIADSAWELKPLSQNGWVDFNFASATTTATNGAILTHGDTSISADSISVNRETCELVAEGSVQMKRGGYVPLGGKLHSNVTRLFAQNQSAVIGSSRIPQGASGRRRIMSKLEAIRLNHVSFDNLPLSEVVNYLQSEAKKRDPEGKGINFILNPNADVPPAGTIDPATGQQVATPQVEPVDINSVAIKILPPLEDVRMLDVLDAMIKVADKRIRFTIEDYGVSFRLAGNEPAPMLFSRVIKVDPNLFAQGLESVVGFSVGNFQTGGQGGGGQQGNGSGVSVPRVQVAPNIGGQGGQGGQAGGQGGGISGVTRPTTAITPQAVRQFFVNAGVDLTPPKSVFFNDRAGTLLVHGTLNDLDLIEQAVGALSTSAAQPARTRISVQAERAEPATVRLYTNEQLVGEQKVNLSPGNNSFTLPSNPVPAATNQVRLPLLGGSPVAGKTLTKTVEVSAANSPQQITNTANVGTGEKLFQPASNIDPPPQINIRAKFVELSQADAKLFFSSLNGSPSRTSGSSTATNSTVGLAEVLSDPKFQGILHELEQRDTVALRSESSVTTLSGRQAQVQNVDVQSIVSINPQAFTTPGVSSSNLLQTKPTSSGPVLDIVPVVKSDGTTVSLEATATVTEFLGYDQPLKGDSTFVSVDGKPQSITPPLPHFRVRSLHNSAKLYDGQTLMLGMPSDMTITYDKEGKETIHPSETRKELLVFITATIIDPAGNPIHNGDPLLLVPDQK
jgi:beta-lactamase regulating signal transducer with metallopeptidase domain